MKKAKPSKGSARTKRFLDGGAVGALAGLGTLAYLMSRKKDKEGGKFEDLKSVEKTKTLKEQIGRGDEGSPMSAEMKRAMATSQGRDALIPEGADEAVMRSDNYATPKAKPKAAVKKPVAKPVAKPVVKAAEKPEAPEKPATQSFPISTAGKANVDLPSKPYPKDAKGTEKPKKRGGIGPYHAFEGVTDYFSRLREGRKRPGETQVAGMKKGGAVKSSASKRADGIAQRGKTRGRVC